jgi:hypothetical protein
MAGMAGTALGVAIAVFREKADRRAIEREAKKEAGERRKSGAAAEGEEAPGKGTQS